MHQMVKVIMSALVACPYLTGTMNSTSPQPPSQPHIDHSHTNRTPHRCKTPSHNRKPGINKLKRSIQKIKAELNHCVNQWCIMRAGGHLLHSRGPLEMVTHKNRWFSLHPFDVAFKGEFEETDQGEDQMKVDLQASLSEIWDLVDPE